MNRKWRAALLIGAFVSASAMSGQERALDRVMRKKLAVSQTILAAVVTSDWISLETQSRDLEALTHDPAWMVLNSPEY